MKIAPKSQRSLLQGEEGFTLVELTLAIGLFALLMVAFVGTMLSAFTLTGHTSDRAFALKQAQTVLNTVRNARDQGATVPDGIVQQFPTGAVAMVGNQLPGQVAAISYTDVDASPLVVTVSVSWSEATGRTVSESLTALLGP